MNWKRAIWTGAILWILIFFEVSILMFGLKLNPPNVFYYIIHYILLAILVGIMASVFFSKSKKGFGEGLFIGLIFVVIGVILDAAITLPLWVVPGGGSYSAFFLTLGTLTGYLETIIIAGIIGSIKK